MDHRSELRAALAAARRAPERLARALSTYAAENDLAGVKPGGAFSRALVRALRDLGLVPKGVSTPCPNWGQACVVAHALARGVSLDERAQWAAVVKQAREALGLIPPPKSAEERIEAAIASLAKRAGLDARTTARIRALVRIRETATAATAVA